MQTKKNRTSEKSETASLKVIVVENDQARIEREIEKNIQKIRALIRKLRPADRQKYFDGLLSHMLSEPVELSQHPNSMNKKRNSEKDYSTLSFAEMKLIEELSLKIEQLYRTMDQDLS